MLEQLFTIARNTFTESIRQPVFVVLLLLGALALVLNPMLSAYTMEDDNKLMVDMSLSTIFLIGLWLSALTATGVLSDELENKTVLTVVSKPVARPVFVLGKYVGVAAAIGVAFYLLSLTFLFTRRHGVMQTASDPFDGPVLVFGVLAAVTALLFAAAGNYLYRRVFTSTFVTALVVTMSVAAALIAVLGKGWHFQSPMTAFAHDGADFGQLSIGLVMIFQAVLVLAAVAIAASTRLGQIMTLLICTGTFLIGLVGHSINAVVNEKLSLARDINVFQSIGAVLGADLPLHLKLGYGLTKGLYVLLPNLQFLWPADALTQGHPFTLGHIATLTTYAGLSIIAVLCIAVMLFQTREVG